MTVDFGAKRQLFRSHGFVCQIQKVNAHDQIKIVDVWRHSRPQSSSLLRMTDGEKSSGELWTKLFRYLLLVETKKARLIGQSVMR